MKHRGNNFALHLSTLVVATACFVVMGSALLISQNLKSILTLWGEDMQMTVYLAQDLSSAQQKKIEDFLHQQKNVQEVVLVNQEKALGEFRTQLASYAPDLAKDDELLKLIPLSYQVRLDSTLSSTEQVATLKSIAAEGKSIEGIDEVSYGQDWVEKYSIFVSAIQAAVQILALVLVCASIFVMSNAIRAFVQSRYEEIAILELVGATPSMIRRPFLLQGAQTGLVASVLALAGCFAIHRFLKSFFMAQLSFLQIGSHFVFFSLSTSLVLILAGTLLGGFASYLCVRKINDGWAARQSL